MKVEIDTKTNEIVVRMPMQAPQPSASGKTLVVASTRGNKESEARVNGKPVYVGFNAYTYR